MRRAMSKSTENTGSIVRYGRLPVFVFEGNNRLLAETLRQSGELQPARQVRRLRLSEVFQCIGIFRRIGGCCFGGVCIGICI